MFVSDTTAWHFVVHPFVVNSGTFIYHITAMRSSDCKPETSLVLFHTPAVGFHCQEPPLVQLNVGSGHCASMYNSASVNKNFMVTFLSVVDKPSTKLPDTCTSIAVAFAQTGSIIPSNVGANVV